MEIHRAYERSMTKWEQSGRHDVNTFILLKEAYDTLGNEQDRMKYDEMLKEERHGFTLPASITTVVHQRSASAQVEKKPWRLNPHIGVYFLGLIVVAVLRNTFEHGQSLQVKNAIGITDSAAARLLTERLSDTAHWRKCFSLVSNMLQVFSTCEQ